jgi:hypothetical protein
MIIHFTSIKKEFKSKTDLYRMSISFRKEALQIGVIRIQIVSTEQRYRQMVRNMN